MVGFPLSSLSKKRTSLYLFLFPRRTANKYRNWLTTQKLELVQAFFEWTTLIHKLEHVYDFKLNSDTLYKTNFIIMTRSPKRYVELKTNFVEQYFGKLDGTLISCLLEYLAWITNFKLSEGFHLYTSLRSTFSSW